MKRIWQTVTSASLVAISFGCASASPRPSEPSRRPVPTDEALGDKIVATSSTEGEPSGVYYDWTCPNVDGESSFNIRLVFDEPSTAYSWRGRIDPALGHVLFVDATRDGVPLEVSRAPGPVPVFPHRDDTVTGSEIGYEHPLRVRFTAPDGPPAHGGTYSIEVRYDTTHATHPSYGRAGLSRVAITSGVQLRVCE